MRVRKYNMSLIYTHKKQAAVDSVSLFYLLYPWFEISAEYGLYRNRPDPTQYDIGSLISQSAMQV